jgi:hypothetical protein
VKTLRLYRHPHCASCTRLARLLRWLDWFGRTENATIAPPTGPLNLGEVVVQNITTGTVHRGADGFALLCPAIPLYAPARLLLPFPWFRTRIDRAWAGHPD